MPKITFLATGLVLEVPSGASYLEVCKQHKAPQDFGCTVGSCGTCRLELVAGANNVDPATDDEKETISMCTDFANARLGCQLKVRGDLSVRPVE
jgi:ferredoxin